MRAVEDVKFDFTGVEDKVLHLPNLEVKLTAQDIRTVVDSVADRIIELILEAIVARKGDRQRLIIGVEGQSKSASFTVSYNAIPDIADDGEGAPLARWSEELQ
ncbi:hypothetical protein BDW62DRAFT_205880 [Aspergillus aurantiobrunneus]